jgi:hypothetical protein
MAPVITREAVSVNSSHARTPIIRQAPPPVGHSNSHGPFLEHYGHGPLVETPPHRIMGCPCFWGWGNPKLNLIRRKFAPLQKLNTTEAHLQRLQNYAAGTVTMTIVTDFSPPLVISMTHLRRHKKATPRRTFWRWKNQSNPS